jgi:hypothetical protein
MKHRSAIDLWNNTCQIFYPQEAEMTKLGIAATAKDVPVWLSTISDFAIRNMETCKPEIDKNVAAALFLREWADAIVRAKEE